MPLGLLGLAKISWQVFGHCAGEQNLLRELLLPLGAATAVVGALMAWLQRHLKRLLGLSTIAHMGIVLTGAASGQALGAAGLLAYIVGHALVKGALFTLAGVLLAVLASNDEIELRGRGRSLPGTALLMLLAGLLLAGAPWGILHAGDDMLGEAAARVLPGWGRASTVFAAAVTGAAVLRAAGRIFLGWDATAGIEAEGPTEPEREKANRPVWLMLLPCVVMLALSLWPALLVIPQVMAAGARVARLPAQDVPGALGGIGWGTLSASLALVIAGLALGRERLPPRWTHLAQFGVRLLRRVRDLHSGVVNEYVAWQQWALRHWRRR